jgi:lipopolysaccharide export system permease protein
MTTFDRYILRRYWHVFGVGFLALFGLYFVIDIFTNVTEFFFDQSKDTRTLLTGIIQYYSYRACYFFNLIGGTLEVVAAMVTMALVQKHGELNPILSAGVSTFRLMRTLLVGACMVNGLILLNQEFVIPRIAVHLQFDAGHQSDVTGEILPVRDFATDMLILGKRVNLREQRVEEAEFVLRPPKLSEKLTTIRAREAYPQDKRHHGRTGWLLKGATVRFDALQLTEKGRKFIKRGDADDELFIRTDVGIDQLYSQESHYEYLPTWELMRRLQNPSFSNRSLRSQNLFLQARVTKPLLNLIVVAVGVPFVVRRESISLLTNMAICCGVMGAMLGVNELYMYLGKANILAPELAVWAPIITWGTAAAWFTGFVRT